jgi:hypothetical protein
MISARHCRTGKQDQIRPYLVSFVRKSALEPPNVGVRFPSQASFVCKVASSAATNRRFLSTAKGEWLLRSAFD